LVGEFLFRCAAAPPRAGERAGERAGVWRLDLPPLGPSEAWPAQPGSSGASTIGLGKCSAEACSRSAAEREEGRGSFA
jgi:hypothetical protein